MKIRLNFNSWDESRSLKHYKKRIWIAGFWTPFIKVQLRQESLKL